ncbi:reactive mitochondrial oxygen species modulator 1-domain-containing protein [Mucidula mucida]|nr:reactive mitochondrial oxygen species modulator 1-domain-containing protein [Mucidula mucida]
MGAMMGAGVGLTIGFIFGSWSVFRHGAGPRGVLSTLSTYMLTSATSFAFFLSIGAVIRNDSIPPHMEAARLQLLSSMPVNIQSRNEGLRLMKARWEQERAQK